jgi:hypothetical protein
MKNQHLTAAPHTPARRPMLAWAAASLLITLTGCTIYQAPNLPTDQTATIVRDPKTYKLKFTSVDGAAMSSIGELNSFAGNDPLTLAPGKRRIGIKYSDFDKREGRVLLVFEAQAGQRYVVHERLEGKQFYAWITTDKGAPVKLLDKD